jgi:hypothetical protein
MLNKMEVSSRKLYCPGMNSKVREARTSQAECVAAQEEREVSEHWEPSAHSRRTENPPIFVRHSTHSDGFACMAAK